jgi:hypothetical protein
MGNRAISFASASAARALGKGASRAASSHGSTRRRVNAETTLSVTPFCSSPTEAKRKSFRSEHQRQPARAPLPWPAQLQLRQLDVDGKQDRYWSVVENTRTARGRVVQRHVLYLGEINDTQG